MKCARVNLQERFIKSKVKPETRPPDKPRRYCQRRMVNPQHEEDPRWTDIYERYHCNIGSANLNDTLESARANTDAEDLFLTVQTLQFQGDVDQTKRCRTSFKYKTPTDGAKHRMFVKQPVDNDYSDDDRSSQLTCYYFDDYVKYLFNNEKSRPGSGKSSIFLQGLSNKKVNKSTQVDAKQTGGDNKISRKLDSKVESLFKKRDKVGIEDEIRSDDAEIDDTKITFRKSGRRKSLTISRTQSPETVQVIRVDVVCNYSTSSQMSDYDNNKLDYCKSDTDSISIKGSHFANKYLLTDSIKKLDENLSNAKVTLLCKTFKLSERNKTLAANKPNTNTDDKLRTKESKKSSSKKSYSKNKVRRQIRFLEKQHEDISYRI